MDDLVASTEPIHSLIGHFVSLVYLLLCIAMSITTYMGCHRGPFGKHPHIIRFGFLPGLVGSELCIHLISLMVVITLFIWKFNLFHPQYFFARVGASLMVLSSLFLLKTYFGGFQASKVNQKTLDSFCGIKNSSNTNNNNSNNTTNTNNNNNTITTSNNNNSIKQKRESIISSVRTLRRFAFAWVENFLFSKFKKLKRDDITWSSSNLPPPNPRSMSFWLKMLVPLPQPHFPNVQRICDVPYGEDIYQKVDVYFHKSNPTNRPILIYVHGGGWRKGGGRRGTCGLPLIYQMANQRWIVFTVGYRLSPFHKFPTHIKDVKKAITWVRENAVHYGGDIDCIFMAGGSAGGHLATLATLTDGLEFEEFQSSLTIKSPTLPSTPSPLNQPLINNNNNNNNNSNNNQNVEHRSVNINMNSLKLESSHNNLLSLIPPSPNGASTTPKTKKQYPPFRGCVSMYAVYDFTNRNGSWPFDLVTYLGQLIMRSTYEQEPHLYSMSSPIDQIKESLKTPFFIIHGDLDELVPIEESLSFIKKFKEVVNPSRMNNLTWMEVPGGHHAFDLIYSPRTIYTVHGIYRYLNRLYRQHVYDKVQARKLQQKQQTQHTSPSSSPNATLSPLMLHTQPQQQQIRV